MNPTPFTIGRMAVAAAQSTSALGQPSETKEIFGAAWRVSGWAVVSLEAMPLAVAQRKSVAYGAKKCADPA